MVDFPNTNQQIVGRFSAEKTSQGSSCMKGPNGDRIGLTQCGCER